MEKKKIIFINNHFQYSDGTVNALIGIINQMDLEKFDVTVLPLYRCDRRREKELPDGVHLKKGFGFYFKGFSKIVRKLPRARLYKKFIGGKYDIEIAFQCDVPTLLVGDSQNKKAVHVAWMHGYDLYAESFKKCDKVVCVSKCNADRTFNEMQGEVNVTYRYNLVDDEKITEQSKEEIPANFKRPLFVTVGRLSPEKGFLRLINIMGELRKEGYEFSLYIVGGGAEEPALKNAITANGLEGVVTLTGEDKNPHKYTVKADAFICSSFSEGYSTACTEAAILGVPIITTNVAGGEEIINMCECGLLTKIEDESLKEGIKKVLDNPELLASWKETMQQTRSQFTLQKRKKEMNELFDELYDLSEKKINEN